jgi:LPXTG-site transpeptidase (sortase) family protein
MFLRRLGLASVAALSFVVLSESMVVDSTNMTDPGPSSVVESTPAAVTPTVQGSGPDVTVQPSQPAATPSGSPKPSATQHKANIPPSQITSLVVMRGGKMLYDFAVSDGAISEQRSNLCPGTAMGRSCLLPPEHTAQRFAFGELPRLPSHGSTIMGGHSNVFHPSNEYLGVFTRIHSLRKGDAIVLTTSTGVFRYRVDSTVTLGYADFNSNNRVTQIETNTLKLVTCEFSADGTHYTGNFAVIARLVSAKPLG